MGKSAHHKDENTFKFQSFAERIAQVNIDVIHRIRYNDDQPEASGTYFGEALTKWTELNCTEHFSNFRAEISPQVQTFTQLVHHEPEIVSGLQKHLEVPNSLAYEPLLDLVVQLARDLQSDFYKHFTDFFNIMVSLLNSHPQDTELLEKVFTCLSYLFKFLWRYLLKDMENVYGTFSTLLSSSYKVYIQNFSAESFSFLMRKVKSQDNLLNFLFKSLQDKPEQTPGLGRLLFEGVKGVGHQFHSCLNQMFPMILGKLGQIQDTDGGEAIELPWEQVEEAVGHMMLAMADYSTPDNLLDAWNMLLADVDRLTIALSKGGKLKRPLVEEQLTRLLRLIQKWLIYHEGNFIKNPDQIATCFIGVLKGTSLPNDGGDALLEDVAQLLLLSHSKLSMENTAKLISLSFKANYDNSLLNKFTKQLFILPLFEKDVLPSLLVYCDKQIGATKKGSQTAILSLISQLILHKCPIPKVNRSSLNTDTYMLDFSAFKTSKKKKSVPQYLLDVLSSTRVTVSSDDESLCELWSVLVCLPHVRPMQKEDTVENIHRLTMENLELLKCSSPKKSVLLSLLYQLIYTLALLQEDGEIFTWFTLENLYQLWCFYDSMTFLRICDLYFSLAKEEEQTNILELAVFETIFSKLNRNLSSSSHEVRLLTLRIFTQFDLPLPEIEDRTIARVSVFYTCYQAESVAISVREYKQKLMYLRNLNHDIVHNSLPVGNYTQVPLQFLIGSLYNNFKLLWEPICELIGGHGNGLDKQLLWEIYLEQLKKASDQTEYLCRTGINQQTPVSDDQFQSDSELASVFNTHMENLTKETTKPDMFNFRSMLWKSMQQFPMKTESKSREIIPLFMRFLHEEYYPADLNAAPSQDITMTTNQGQITDDDEEEENNKTPKKGGFKKKAIKALVEMLGVFSKFTNPRSVFMEPKLTDIYHQLLLHQSDELQKSAFYCLLTYKWKFLMPYKENFERLLDEETFKHELVMFNLDEESSPVKPEHRAQLLPILFRLLYGKMNGKTGNNSSGKGNSTLRRSIVFRFLAGCKQGELKIFLDMVFEPSKGFLSDNPLKKLEEIRSTLDLNKVIPLKKMQGIIITIDVLSKKLGHLLEDYLPSLLQILLGLAQVCVGCLATRETIRPGAVKMLKNIRQLIIGQMIQFFQEFEDYNFTDEEIQAVFRVAVWPQLEKLPIEGVYHPTALLKLFQTWSKNPRYVCLLGMCEEKDSTPPLQPVFSLLLIKPLHPSVISSIIQITDNLLSMPDFEPTSESRLIPVQNSVASHVTSHVIPVQNSAESQQRPIDNTGPSSLGSRLLHPHIHALLTHIQGVVKQLAAEQKKKSAQITELRILSRVSSFVTNENECISLIELLLPFLGKSSAKSPDMEKDILTSILNLIKSVDNPSQFYRPICRLFSTIENRQSRQILCEIFKVFGEKIASYSTVTELVSQLNSWDRRRMEEPDYTLRLGAFQTINTSVKEMTDVNVDFLIPIIHNSCFFIVMVDDLSLRDNSTHCMVTMVKRIGDLENRSSVFQELISQGLLPEVKAGIRHKKEGVRHEFISLLAVLINTFSSEPSFSDLTPLTDKDLEADFFENIRHIQTHRRARALRRLIKHLQGHPMRLEFIHNYLLPLTSGFLLDESYLKYNSLQDAAVDAMGTLCHCLPWRHYLIQLRSYLGLLPKKINLQKLLIRIIVAVLDAFHFDLSGSTFEISKAPSAINSANETVEGDANNDVPEDMLIDQSNTQTDGQVVEIPFSLLEKFKCSADQATKIHSAILKSILPQLHKSLTQKVRSEGEHKLARSNYAEDDEVLRVPLALAMIKLLQNLPRGSLYQTLPSVLMKVCHFLKSRSLDVREVARDTLVKMATSLGTHYFSYILTEMRSTLKRGYQLHVLTYTIHAILRALHTSGQMSTGDLDGCLPSLIEVFNEEVFGQVAEEKDVQGIVGKLMEAKTSKSYDSYELVSVLCGRDSIGALIRPLKEILDNTKSHKSSKKAQDILKRVCKGLLENKGLTEEILLVFIHGLTSDTLPMLFDHSQKEKTPQKEELKPGQKPPSCLLLAKAAPRGGYKPKSSRKTNAHIIVEFGLQLFQLLLKKSRLVATNMTHLEMCAPFIPVLADCLSSKHIKMTSVTLRCLCWLLKFPIPSLKSHIDKMASEMFVLLKNYASAGAAKGDNKELVAMCFKAVTVLVRDVKVYTLTTDQLKVLISFCEEDIHDYDRQGTAFTLLKAILYRKLVLPEIHELMGRIEKMALTSESAHVRLQSRQITLQYLMDYPLGTKLQKHLEFFVTQLKYDLESGRESVLEMLATIFSNFPQHILIQYSGLFFLPMAASLTNDESAKCKKLTALALKSLVEKVDLATRNRLFNLALKWMDDEKLRHRVLGAQLCGLFVEVESAKFEHRLAAILPVISKQIHPDEYKLTDGVGVEQDKDRLLFNCLTTLIKILRECDVIRNEHWMSELNTIWSHIESHLLFPHVWVQFASSQLFGLLFSSWTPEELVSMETAATSSQDYLLGNTVSKLSSLATNFCTQLQSTLLDQDLAEQVIKNMVFITKTAKLISSAEESHEKKKTEKLDTSEKRDSAPSLSVRWLVKKMVREANHETIHQPKITIKRRNVFKWIGAVSIELGETMLPDMLPLMLPPLIRESSEKTNTTDDTLKILAQEVLELIKATVGVEDFTKQYSTVHQVLQERRINRKRLRAEEMVLLSFHHPKKEICGQFTSLLMNFLSNSGFEVETARGKLRIKGHLLAVSLDLPAKALVSNMKQFNGKSSCTFCLDEGKSAPGNTLHRFFPYKQDSVRRSHSGMVEDAKEATRQNNAVNGIKGASPLLILNYIDLPKVFVIDWMHCVLLGVCKALMRFWFTNQNKGKDFYIGDRMVLLNKRLLSIKTPDYVSRRPRNLEEHGHWKATECREWLIHFSAPVLHGLLNSSAYTHYLVLVTAMSLLTKDVITREEVDYAESLLEDFCKLFPDIYGELSQTMNIHLLKHLGAYSRLYGPLFGFSCFGFESMNSYLKRMFHGTRYINNQTVSNPEIAARRKIKKNLHKKEAKKRRIEEIRPSKKLKKRKF